MSKMDNYQFYQPDPLLIFLLYEFLAFFKYVKRFTDKLFAYAQNQIENVLIKTVVQDDIF